MTDHPQQPNPIQSNYYPDDEIELIDYLRALWNRKWLIVLVTLVCMVAAGVFSFMIPKVHEISTIIEPGIIGIDEIEGPVYMDSPSNIAGKIEFGVYNAQILNKLDVDPHKTGLKFKVVNPKNTTLIKISSEWEQSKISTGTKVFAQLLTELSHDYEKLIRAKEEDINKQVMAKQNQLAEIDVERKDIDKQIVLNLSNIQKKEDRIKLQETLLKNMRDRENELIREVKQIKNNTKMIEQQGGRALEGKSGEDSIALLLHFATVQQNIASLNQLNNELHNLRTKQEKAEAEIEKLNKDINDIHTGIARLKTQKTEKIQVELDEIKAEIDRLNFNKNFIEDIKLIREPKASASPIRPKKKLNIALGGVVGFMLSVFIGCFAEYIRKHKEEGTVRT